MNNLWYAPFLFQFLPDEEWDGISPHRYCWFHSEVTNHSGEILAYFIDKFTTTCAVWISCLIHFELNCKSQGFDACDSNFRVKLIISHLCFPTASYRLLPLEQLLRRYRSRHYWCMWLISGTKWQPIKMIHHGESHWDLIILLSTSVIHWLSNR